MNNASKVASSKLLFYIKYVIVTKHTDEMILKDEMIWLKQQQILFNWQYRYLSKTILFRRHNSVVNQAINMINISFCTIKCLYNTGLALCEVTYS